jgi:hypothetical protein
VKPARARRAWVGLILFASVAGAQPAGRRATNIASILAYPGFYHGRQILIVGKVALEQNGRLKVEDEAGAAGSVNLVVKGNAPDGLDEIRGEFWDVGRMKPDDPRLSTYDLRATFHFDPDGPWPRPGEVTAILASAVTPASPPLAPSIRAIVLNPARYVDQKVTLTGQYSGRNLLGDLPDAPGRSRYDFVIRSADASLWVANIRPRVKDTNGKDFELSLDSRIDSGRWITVRGTVQHARGLMWVEAEAGSLALARPPAETTTAEEPVRVPAGPPPEVVFSAPINDETDVASSTTVRIQFSRDLDQSTLRNRIKASYMDAPGAAATPAPAPEFTTQYNAAARVLEIRFAKPLERFRTLKVDLVDGIVGTDGQALKPWTLSFSVGGS